MAKIHTSPQTYPRLDNGLLDDSTLAPHRGKIPVNQLKDLIIASITRANEKSSREILSIPSEATSGEIKKIYKEEGVRLFKYFKKYCGDPASTAHQIYNMNCRKVGEEQFRNQTLQKHRMNSGWRYQFLAYDCALNSRRFASVSDLGSEEADFIAAIKFVKEIKGHLNLYVSVKNRGNTVGGQDMPKAIHALEHVAKNDKNRSGPYCCVFGIAMDSGKRNIKHKQKTGIPYSINTEIWYSDFFWPFFANYSYEEIMTLVLEVLSATGRPRSVLPTQLEAPSELLDSFAECCQKEGLLDESGNFNDALRLVKFFCNRK